MVVISTSLVWREIQALHEKCPFGMVSFVHESKVSSIILLISVRISALNIICKQTSNFFIRSKVFDQSELISVYIFFSLGKVTTLQGECVYVHRLLTIYW